MGSCMQPSPRRHKPVRLADVPKPVRMKAAYRVIQSEKDPDERLRIMQLAASPPPDLVAWVAA